jgi:FkbM family methyltransferase
MLSIVKNTAKRYLFSRVGIDFNPYGVPYALGKYLACDSPISLIDVGARQGDFTRAVDAMCGVSTGILVELQPRHVESLREEFRPPRFHVHQCALCDTAGQLQVEINCDDATTSILRTHRNLPELGALDVRSKGTITCDAQTLDLLASKHHITTLDLLKLDVQGAELLVLRGGIDTLSRTRMVWTEISFKRLYENSCLFQDVFDLLSGVGFLLYELSPAFRSPCGELLQSDALFVRAGQCGVA